MLELPDIISSTSRRDATTMPTPRRIYDIADALQDFYVQTRPLGMLS